MSSQANSRIRKNMVILSKRLELMSLLFEWSHTLAGLSKKVDEGIESLRCPAGFPRTLQTVGSTLRDRKWQINRLRFFEFRFNV